jgi:hypothetical protein
MKDRGRSMSNLRILRNGEGWSRNALSGKKVDMNVHVKMLES